MASEKDVGFFLRNSMGKVKDYLIDEQSSINESELENCKTCGRTLPSPQMEERALGVYELVTYCKCGATYYG